jgi:hypothetical protein
MQLNQVINLTSHPISEPQYEQACKQQFDQEGVLVLKDFLTPTARAAIITEGTLQKKAAFYTNSGHNVYLTQKDPAFSDDHPRNQWVHSSKGCITDDQIALDSPLRALYDAQQLRSFLAVVLGEDTLYPYADTLSSINLHYASEGQELGWHFDNSSFAITLLLQSPQAGGQFEYVPKLRNASQGDMNYAGVNQVLKGEVEAQAITMGAGDLMLFRGRDALHRVTPSQGEITRMLVVLAYNAEPNVALSESARMTFYGRLT